MKKSNLIALTLALSLCAASVVAGNVVGEEHEEPENATDEEVIIRTTDEIANAPLEPSVSDENTPAAPDTPDITVLPAPPEEAQTQDETTADTSAESSAQEQGVTAPEETAPEETAPEETVPEEAAGPSAEELTPEEEAAAERVAGPDDGGNEPMPVLSAKEQREAEKEARKREQLVESVTVSPAELESVVFANLERLTRGNNLTIMGLEETISGLESMDYEKMEDTMRQSLNAIASSQDMLEMAGVAEPLAGRTAINSLQSSYDALYEQFESIRNGDMQKSNQDVIRQLKNTEDQLVMGSESLYIALLAMQTQQGALERQLTAMDRTMQEMELRFRLGQISAIQLNEVKTGRAQLASGLETLGMNIRTYKMQLENMLGAVPTGQIQLGELPSVTQKQIAAMDVEADFATAKEKSYELYAATRTLENAEDTFQTQGKQYNYRESNSMYVQARHTWQAAQTTYNNSIRSWELKFRTLYEQVQDYYQVWNAAKTTLAGKQDEYRATELKFQQGTISNNTLLSAQDDLRASEESVQSAANDLFSAYNSYCWAVKHGILN